MSYLLDTNIVSELRKVPTGKADANVVRWVSSRDAGLFFLSVISLLEIERGVLLLQRRDPVQGSRLRHWLDAYLRPAFKGRILPIDDSIATTCAHLHVPNPRSDGDSLIAATALVHGLSVVTRNERDFEGTGVVVINPWQAPGD